MDADTFGPRVSNSLYADDSMLVDHFSMNDNTRHVPTVVKHAEATSESDDVQDNMSIGSLDYPDLEPVLYDSPDRHYWSTPERGQVDFMVGDPSVSSSSRQHQQHPPSSPSKTSRRHHSTSTTQKRRVNSSSEKSPKAQKTSNSNKKGKHVMQPDNVMMEDDENPLYEIEDIVGHKVYRVSRTMPLHSIMHMGY